MSDAVLIVDDDSSMCEMLAAGLSASGHRTATATSGQAAIELLDAGDFDVVITDVRMRGMSGLELCRFVFERRPDIPVIVTTAFGSLETAIEAIRAGAYDFVTKPFVLDAIRVAVQRALRHRALTRRVERLELELRNAPHLGELVGSSRAMRQVFDLVARVAPTETTVLICGESGTGKELVARALHARSARSAGPFVAVNCAAVPESLLESELFGHARGAFTDARGDRRGLFQQAHGGTLLLDEIGELPLALQPKLLRALQERTVRPVGGNTEVCFDARVVAASNRDLEAAVEQGRFREDLYYRVQVIQIDLPPLRARGNDVLLLAQHFTTELAARNGKELRGIAPAAADRLAAYPWPGNVRELRNCIERAVTLCRHSELLVEDLPERVRQHDPRQLLLAADEPGELVMMEEIERRYVLRVYEAAGGNKALAARILGFNRKTLYRRLQRYGLLPGGADEDDGP